MADEQKNPNEPRPPLGPPKDIEDVLKELPKVDISKPSTPPNIAPKPQVSPPPRSAGQSGTLSVPPKPLTLPPLSAKPPTSGMPLPPKPIPPPTTSQEDKFKSLIRTMDEDLKAAQKGQKPEPKPFEIKPPPGGPKIAPPLPPITPRPPSPEIKLGPTEKTKPMETPKGPPAFTPPAPFPKRKPVFNPKLLIIIVVILAAFGGIWFFITREAEEIVIQTPTPTPTPVFSGLSQILENVYPITIASTANFATSFNNSIKNVTPLSFGEFTAVSIKNEGGEPYSLSEIFQKLQVNTPNGLIEGLDELSGLGTGEWLLVAYGQQEAYDNAGGLTFNQTPKIKLGIIAKTDTATSLQMALNSWEVTMTNDLKNLFGINTQKTTSQIFLDNVYRGVNVRYRNFPYADSTIDYAIVSLSKFNLDFFVLTNSRESFYSAIDLLQAQ